MSALRRLDRPLAWLAGRASNQWDVLEGVLAVEGGRERDDQPVPF